RWHLYALSGYFLVAGSKQTEAECIELDEALSVLLVIGTRVILKGDMGFGVERVGRGAANNRCHALVEFQAHCACHHFLALVDKGLKHLALRAPPETVIDQLRIARHQLILQMGRATIKRERFN